MKLDHIALIVSSENNLNFYRNLGFIEHARIVRSYDTVVFMHNDDINLEIFVDPNHPARVTGPEAMGLRHIALQVENLDDITARFPCDPIRTDFFGIRTAFTKDPDGQPIELKEIEK